MQTAEITVTQTFAIHTEGDIDIEKVVAAINRRIKNGEGWLSAVANELDDDMEMSDPYDTEVEVMW